MTIRFLCDYGIYPANAIVTLDAGTETGLIGAKMATADQTGGTVFYAIVTPSQASQSVLGSGAVSVKIGEQATLTLPEGRAISITGAVGTTGAVSLLGSVKAWAIGAGALPPIGPFAGAQRVLITCSAGSVDAVVGSAVPALAQAVSSIFPKLREAYRRNRNNNPHTLPVMTAPPTVALASSNQIASPRKHTYDDLNAFLHTGGDVYTVAGPAARFGVSTVTSGGNVVATRNAVAWRTKLFIDAVAPVFQFVQGSVPIRFMVYVPGVGMQYVDTTGVIASNAGTGNYYQLDFTAAGGRAEREIWVESSLAQTFMSVSVAQTEGVRAVPAGTRWTIFADSFGTGTGADMSANGFAMVLGDCYGVSDIRCSGVGSQGYSTVASGYDLVGRILLDATASDVFVLAMGINDKSVAAATVTAKVLAAITALRSAYPTTLIVVYGCQLGTTNGDALILATEDAIQAGVTAYGADPYLLYIPNARALPNPSIFGTGHIGATTGNGNGDIYNTAADTTHPSTAGHKRIGLWDADRLYGAILNMT